MRDIIKERYCIVNSNASEAACKTVIVKGCENLSHEESIKKYIELQKKNPFERYDFEYAK